MRWGIIERYRLDIVVPVALIILSEILIFRGNMKEAMLIDALNLAMLVLSAIYTVNRLYVALMLLPLFRLLNVAMPVFFHLTLYSYMFVYLPMFLPIYLIMKDGIFSRQEAGITAKNFWLFIPIALALGFAIGWGEYQILRPEMLIPDLSLINILILSLIMIVCVGVVEEFMFRSALQTAMEEKLGALTGLIFTSLIFGLMHSGYHLTGEIIYVSLAGLAFGLLFWASRSLPVIALAHGVTNISLFVITPALASFSIYFVSFIVFIVLFVEAIRWRKPLIALSR
ncbi:MAG: CPBP family intramembrane metalloprotease [Methanotrichaceae archaeon]|nr:CPBP family intramembrane metalloprotease [Methanotrichaceae archaeon]